MKDKADVLMELERLNNVKNELTDEVTKLHALLEQERSKVAALTSESQKVKDKVTIPISIRSSFCFILSLLFLSHFQKHKKNA